MKNIIFPSLAVITVLSCGYTSSINDGKTASQPLQVTQIAMGDTTINFENEEPGKPPHGFTVTQTGKPQELNWTIANDNGNMVVSQNGKNSGEYFNLLVLDQPGYKNFVLSVKIKAVAGEEDRGGGLVWRYIDNNNYYIARCNPLEKNFRFYKVVKGNRKQLRSVDTNTGVSGEWFTMTIEMNGNRISCSLNGKKMIDATDDTYSEAGRVGLWSKADARSYFDDLNINPLK